MTKPLMSQFHPTSGESWRTKAKCVINATGPFTDHIRQMDDPSVNPIVCPSSGIHIVLPDYYSPERMGLLDPVSVSHFVQLIDFSP